MTFYRKTYAPSAGFKMKPEKALPCVKTKTNSNFAVNLAEMLNKDASADSFKTMANALKQIVADFK